VTDITFLENIVFAQDRSTGNPEHLKANVEALSKPPLPKRDLQRLKEIFGTVDSVTGG